MTNTPKSGDYCSYSRKPEPAHMITHYRCDEYRDGTVTDCRTGAVVKVAPFDAPRGFKRP